MLQKRKKLPFINTKKFRIINTLPADIVQSQDEEKSSKNQLNLRKQQWRAKFNRSIPKNNLTTIWLNL